VVLSKRNAEKASSKGVRFGETPKSEPDWRCGRRAAGSSTLPWSAISRVWAGKDVVLVFYSIMAEIMPPSPGRLSRKCD